MPVHDSLAALHTAAGAERVPSARGSYQGYYADFAAAVRGEGPLPVTVEEGRVVTLD